jgi:hypothetical protein
LTKEINNAKEGDGSKIHKRKMKLAQSSRKYLGPRREEDLGSLSEKQDGAQNRK